MQDALSFVKMSGTGNDFILVDNRSGAISEEEKPALARALCPRRTSIGADGLILLEESGAADVRMRILNADGSEPAMCGNGSRCLAHFALSLGAAGPEMKIQTLAGVVEARVFGERVDGARVDGARVRVELTPPAEVVSKGVLEFAGEEREVMFTDTGVPHAVVLTGDSEDLEVVPVREWGHALRFHEAFGPVGANANFVKLVAPQKIALRTYERGVEDETLACGTGAVAAALVAASRQEWPSPVTASVRSGEELAIHFRGDPPAYEAAMLEGAVSLVYRGEIDAGIL